MDLINKARLLGATDIHMGSGKIWMRLQGKLAPMSIEADKSVSELIQSIVKQYGASEIDGSSDIKDFSFDDGLGRVRAHLYYSIEGEQLALRLLPVALPSVLDLGLPRAVSDIVHFDHGLIIVTGATGSGKSTTLAAILDLLVKTRPLHLMTFESPVEYILADERALIHQTEVSEGEMVEALVHALRADPDVVMVGEVRRAEEMQAVLSLAETGHLVLTTLHTPTAVEAVARIIDLFPDSRQGHVRNQLASLLRLVIGQRLLPQKNGKELVLAAETLSINHAVANQIRENRLFHLADQQENENDALMQSLDTALANLVKNGLLDERVAWAHVQNRERFSRRLHKGGQV